MFAAVLIALSSFVSGSWVDLFDPGEQHDLSRSKPLDPWRERLGPAHEMPAGLGWRIRTELEPDGEPFVFRLPQPAQGAVVVPPSMTIKNPRNQAWGEPPRKSPEEVGEVMLSDDGLTLTFTPGSDPDDGLLFVLFGQPVGPSDAEITRGELPVRLRRSVSWRWQRGGESLVIEPGTVFLPPPSEAQRMRAMQGSAAEIQQLCQLGYLHGEICGEEDDH